MTPEAYMRQALQAAQKAVQDGGVAIGAVLVDNATGNVLASGESIVGVTHDPTAHAEINCIRAVAAQRGTDDLYDCTLYSTLEPCHMCLSAAAWSRISKVYFGAYRKDVDESLFDIKGDFSDEREDQLMNLRDGVTMDAQGGILEAECAALLATYHDFVDHRGQTNSSSPATE